MSIAQPRRVGGRLAFLDSLRGIAATYVVLFHLTFVGDVAPPSPVAGFISFGGTGVMLFFVVSCFSLFYTMPARLKEARPLLSFYLHRLFRIAPLFYAWLAFEILLHRYHDHQPAVYGEIVVFAFNFVPDHQQGIVLASWTIGVEMLFYAIFPLIYFVTRDVFHAIALVVGSMLLYESFIHLLPSLPLSKAAATSHAYWFFLKDVPIFALGAVCFFVVRDGLLARGNERREHALGVVLVAVGIVLMIARQSAWITDGIFAGHPYVWPAIGYAFLLVGLSLNPLRLFVNAITRFLGNVSYSIYLAHAPVISLMRTPYSKIVAALGPNVGYLACVAVTFVIVLPLAYLSYRLIERPGIQLGKACYVRLIQLRGIRPRAATVATKVD